MNDPITLWRKRCREFWREALGYWRYVGRSGFFGFLLLLLIAGSYYYGKALLSLPPGYPYLRIAVPAMLIVLAVCPVRTFLRDADRVFLLPMERRMAPYFRSAWLYSFVWQASLVVLADMALWPLVVKCRPDSGFSFAAASALLLFGKAANLLASREEDRLLHTVHRFMLRVVRWATTGLFVFAVYGGGLHGGLLLLSALVLALGFVAVRPFPSYAVNWELLIEREKTHLSRHYRFFSWFTDVPQLSAAVKRRNWLAGATRFYPKDRDHMLLYLYTKTFARTEAAAVIIRLTLLGILVVAVVEGDAYKWTAYAVLLLVAGVQLGALEQHHRYTFWLQLYPVGTERLPRALSRITFAVLLAMAVLIGSLMAAASKNPPASLAVAAAGLAYAYLYGGVFVERKLRKKHLRT